MKPNLENMNLFLETLILQKNSKISSLKLQRASGISFTTSPFLVSECAILYMRKRIGKKKQKGILVGIIWTVPEMELHVKLIFNAKWVDTHGLFLDKEVTQVQLCHVP